MDILVSVMAVIDGKRRRSRRSRRLIVYGCTQEQYDTLFYLQGGACAICGEPEPLGTDLCVDHDHDTKNIRGLLCRSCNAGLGFLKDSPLVLEKAIEYLQRSHG